MAGTDVVEEPYFELKASDYQSWAVAAGRGKGPGCTLSSWLPLVWPSEDLEFSIDVRSNLSHM